MREGCAAGSGCALRSPPASVAPVEAVLLLADTIPGCPRCRPGLTAQPGLPGACREAASGGRGAPSGEVPSCHSRCSSRGTRLLPTLRRLGQAAHPRVGLRCLVSLPCSPGMASGCASSGFPAARVPVAEPRARPSSASCLSCWGLSGGDNRRLQLFPVFGSADAGTHHGAGFLPPPDPAGFGFTIPVDASFSCQ